MDLVFLSSEKISRIENIKFTFYNSMETMRIEFIFCQTLLVNNESKKTNPDDEILVNSEKISSWPFLRFLKLF